MLPQRTMTERIRRVAQALQNEGLDALVCALPRNVLMLSGYWPVIGRSLGIVTAAGSSAVITPEDEYELARLGWVDEVFTYTPASLERLDGARDATAAALGAASARLGLEEARVGYEGEPAFSPVSYASAHVFGPGLPELLRQGIQPAALVPADRLLESLCGVPTPDEIGFISLACDLAADAFRNGLSRIRLGATETAVAAAFRTPLCDPTGRTNAQRADGFTYCMSGPRSAEAFAAFQRSTQRRIEASDLVLVHCNSFVNGYWTDVTRTYSMGPPSERVRHMYDAVLSAREAALRTIRPGVRASDVDRAAREVIEAKGFASGFKHGTGHGVGFSAIDHAAVPRLHPKSEDVLEVGMVFNVEPGIYESGFAGLRHCDMVLVTDGGAEILTPFHDTLEQLTITTGTTATGAPPVTVWED